MTTLNQKLQMKHGQALAVLNAPPDYLPTFARKVEGLGVVDEITKHLPDGVLLFVTSLEEVSRLLPNAISVVKPGGLLWIAYPKGTSEVKTDVNRDKLRGAIAPSGWQPVRQVALDDTWSAMRFRPENEVGT
jgi:hypothetical protein